MKSDDYYTSGQFMELTHVTKKTLRYYDEHNILKPTCVSESGARYYSDLDLAKMQQILLLKYLGFSLSDIRELTINSSDSAFMESSLNLQKKLIEDKIEQLQIVSKMITDTATAIHKEQTVNWSKMLELIHSMGMEQSLKKQYQNASNISSRINLHSLYSHNRQGWFPWIYEQCRICPGMHILELGCGDGSFWTDNLSLIPEDIHVTLSDQSDGMLRDARRNIGMDDPRFTYAAFDCQDIPYKDAHFDLVLANHVLFYCSDVSHACREIQRVLKPDGTFIASTYGAGHMKEVNQLVESFDDRIILSAEKLYEQFGKENGFELLQPYFDRIQWRLYDDYLLVSDPAPLISYILSCHGNQTPYILDHYKEFQSHVKKYISNGMRITKDAGIFICEK